ncbi:MAG: putative glycoside hydrolase, partial [bacterium]|nr:putative glycoside hydrolase [bacterium]
MVPQMKAIYGLKSDGRQFPGLNSEQIAKQLKEWGITAVFGGYENPELVNHLHQQGISVYAERAIFAGEKYWKSHPESRPITDKGLPLEKDKWYAGVCPNQDWLRAEKLNEIKKLCENYQLDGIWLDFIRYPCHWEVKQPRFDRTCFCPVCLAKFQKETKIRIPNHLTTAADKAKWLLNVKKVEWNKWRTEQITDFVHQAKKVIKQQPRPVLVGMFGVPWRETDFNYAIIDYIAQDYRALAKDIDIFSPMVYHKMCG